MSFKDKLLATLIYIVVTLYSLTWRYKFHNKESYFKLYNANKSHVMAVWHDQLLFTSFPHRGEDVVTIASDSKDGSLISSVLTRWRYNVARGSSTRGGIKAALCAIKLAKDTGKPVAVTVDGPKGPRHIVKSGALLIAKKLDQNIIFAMATTKHYKRFASWDKFILPLPFAKIDMYYSDPISVSADTDDESMKKDTAYIQEKMLEFTNVCSPDFV